MSGYWTEGTIGNSEAEAQGTDIIPSTTGEVLSATFGQVFAENPASRGFRLIARNLEAYPITMSPEEATAEYGVPGRLTFTEPTSRTTARDLHDFHTNSAIREDVIRRRAGGIGTGMVARFGVGLAASIIDPLNVASAFIPGVREARVASMLGATGASVASRMAVRALAGGSAGLAGAAALEPLNYWLSQQDKDDYTMGDVLLNLAFGTAAGGVLHSGLGAIRDRSGPLPAWSPPMHEGALRQSLAATADGQPVHAAAAMEFVAAREARSELRTWYETLAVKNREAERAMGDMDAATGPVASERVRLVALREEAEKVAGEIADARARLAQAGIEPETRGRLDEVEAELRGTIPRARRAALERERTMLLEGRDWAAEAPGTSPLEAGRTQAEIDGLSALAGRLGEQLDSTEARLRAAMAERQEAGGIFTARSAALSAREAITRDLAARTIRRMAGRLGVQLDEGEALEMASKFLRADANASRGVLDGILNDLSKRVPYGPYVPSELVSAPGAAIMDRADKALAAREARAERALADAVRGTADPRNLAADRSAAERAERAPKVEGSVADELAEAEKATKELSDMLAAADKQFAEREVAAGRAAPEPDPELVAADDMAKEGEAMGKAFEAAAVCAIGRMA